MSRVPTVRFQVLHKGGIHVDAGVYIAGNRVGNLELTDDVFAALWGALEASELVEVEVAILRPVKGHRDTWCWTTEAEIAADKTGDRVHPQSAGEEP